MRRRRFSREFKVEAVKLIKDFPGAVQGKLDVPLLCLFRATVPTRKLKNLRDQ
jgi:hypothetical protein